jgi:hypothetical protein
MAKLTKTSLPTEYQEIRKASSAMNEQNDCSVVAIAIACGVSYEVAHAALKKAGRIDRHGTYRWHSKAAIESLGFKVRAWNYQEKRAMISRYPGVHSKLQSITTHHMRRFPQAWADCHPNLIVASSRHMLAIKDGVVRDWSINNAMRLQDIWEITKA